MGNNKWRVVAVYKDSYKLTQNENTIVTKVTGNFRNNVLNKSDFPAVGDWVYLNEGGLIEGVAIRFNQLSRKSPGKRSEEQVIAANIDIMFIVTSLNKEFNINKIGRYIVLAETSHITPIILLTKLDLCDNSDLYIEKVNFYYPNVEVILISAFNDVGITTLLKKMEGNISTVFIGASGVGKSTLVNKLLGKNIMKTSEIRKKDDKGCHTTTYRELFELDNGSCIIDTPGIREIGLWINDENLLEFQDVYILSQRCKYRNCKHIKESGCAVKQAVLNGTLSEERYESYLKMNREIYYSKLEQDEGERLRFKSKVKRMCKNERYNHK